MKKVISLFLSLAMLLAIISGMNLTAYAETYGDFEYSYIEDDRLSITGYNGSATNPEIPSAINGVSVTEIGESAFENCTSLTSVTIPDSVTSIGFCAFYNCKSLTSVTIPDSVTSISESAFEDCKSLTSATIPYSVTSIGDYAYHGCYFTSENFVNNSNVELDDSSKPTIVDTDAGGFCIKFSRFVSCCIFAH